MILNDEQLVEKLEKADKYDELVKKIKNMYWQYGRNKDELFLAGSIQLDIKHLWFENIINFDE